MPDKPEESLASTLAALWHAAAGAPLSAERAEATPLPPLDAAGEARLRSLVERRLAGDPLAHLTGRQQFMGVELLAAPGALIPRKETEVVGQLALAHLKRLASAADSVTLLDACTGSGNLALALASHEPKARAWGADLSEDAVALARDNARHLGLEVRVRFVAGDLLAPFETEGLAGRADLLVCNPPYISSAKVDTMPGEIIGHEPRLAFDGGPLGIRILQRLIEAAPRFVRPGGVLAFEVGLGQGRGVRKRLEQNGAYSAIEEATDAAGHVRALAATVGA